MQAYAYGRLMLGPTPFDGGGYCKWITHSPCRRRLEASATGRGRRNHYDVLGISPDASSLDIKRAYRLLALKVFTIIAFDLAGGLRSLPYHPDVNKEIGANEDFKSIRLAYDTLINETTRTEYDRTLCHQQRMTRPLGDDWTTNSEYEDELRFHRWAYLRRKMRHERYRRRYHAGEEQFSSDDDKAYEKKKPVKKRGSFVGVLRSAFITLFLMQTMGFRLFLAYSGVMALVDKQLDAGYKLGLLLACILGGWDGFLLTIFLSFATWVCGKTSSSVVVLVVVAMWFGSSLASYAPIPQGALLTLLYMSFKLQVDLT
ncbi:chaperone protein DNAj [Striga asiatica]|uniref:Chaperone protein DNAj n=1 Tax=Striga asiatica TaxID=4170 RepID=A0A5A7RIP9_STRAF|nr:chaperone protein DNAj [Striga asiatica]